MIPLARASISAAEKEAVLAVLDSGWLTHGPKTHEFETLFARYIGVRHAIAMNSCTSALYLALVANEIRGEVILPSMSFIASANAVLTAGATPVFADVKADTFNIDPNDIREALSHRTEAIMAVHFGGQSCDMAELQDICDSRGLLLVEDSAETIGGTYQGQRTGSFGVGCFSFFPSKNITTGEGGMLTTNDDQMAERVRAYVAHGIVKSPTPSPRPWERVASLAGYNFRLSNILAAIGVEQIKRIDALNGLRRSHAAVLTTALSECPHITTPIEAPDNHHVYQMYVIKLSPAIDRDELVAELRRNGVEASVHFNPPLHKQPLYGTQSRALPVTEAVCQQMITLPMYPDLTSAQLKTISETVLDCVTRAALQGAQRPATVIVADAAGRIPA